MNIKKFVSSNLKVPPYVSEGIKYVVITLIGNLFPIWLLVLIEGMNNGFTCDSVVKTIHQPFTYLILSASFLTTTIYMWIKQLKKSSNEGFPTSLIIITIVLYPLIGFLCSKKDLLEKHGDYPAIVDVSIYLIFLLVVGLYIFFQIKEFYHLHNTNYHKEREVDQKILDGEFEDLGNTNK